MSGAGQDSASPPEPDEDGKVADTGPVFDVGAGSIDDERPDTRESEEPARAAPPETELPPD